MTDLIWQLLAIHDSSREAFGSSDPAVQTARTAKVVRKPWGVERWLVDERRPFGFKLIQINAGHRTSLQFHERKQEANLVLAGAGYVYLAQSVDAPTRKHAIAAGHIIDIPARTVHRILARTDLAIIEVSTPELDDVIRIEDDARRENGRIESEHEVLDG